MKNLDNALSQTIQMHRLQAQMSQSDLANKSRLSEEVIAAAESGCLPSISELDDIAAGCNTKLSDLIRVAEGQRNSPDIRDITRAILGLTEDLIAESADLQDD